MKDRNTSFPAPQTLKISSPPGLCAHLFSVCYSHKSSCQRGETLFHATSKVKCRHLTVELAGSLENHFWSILPPGQCPPPLPPSAPTENGSLVFCPSTCGICPARHITGRNKVDFGYCWVLPRKTKQNTRKQLSCNSANFVSALFLFFFQTTLRQYRNELVIMEWRCSLLRHPKGTHSDDGADSQESLGVKETLQ